MNFVKPTFLYIVPLLLFIGAQTSFGQSLLSYTSEPLIGEEIQAGADIGLLDPICPNPNSCELAECSYRSFIRLGVNPLIDETINWDPNQQYEITVVFDVGYYKRNGDYEYLTDQKLSVNFRNTGGVMKDQHVLILEGGYDIKVGIIEVSMSPSGLPLPKSLYMLAEIEYERFKDLANDIPAVHPSTDGDFMYFGIEPIAGAHRYEIEWTWLDNELVDPSLNQFNFRLNSTRVLLAPNELLHRIPNVFREGHVAARVRAIGRRKKCSNWVESKWSIETVGDLDNLTLNEQYVHVDGHLEDFNWQHSRNYSEDGKQKDGITYADGTLRARQEVSKLESRDQAIAMETYYDHAGRPTVQALPTPVLKSITSNEYENKVTFYSSLNENQAGQPYSRSDFETDEGNCQSPAPPLNTQRGAGLYYSDNNLDKDGIQAYTPDAEGFVISQTIYAQDASGRPRYQGGVGEHFQIGGGHEMKYFYGTPEQQELDRLFGNNVGFVNYYFKKLIVDPNGQVRVEYIDNKDRIIASALAGEAPPPLDQLPNTSSVAHIISEISELNNLENGGTLNASYNLQKQFVVSGNNTAYSFDYSYQPTDFSDPECVPDECYDCIYNFKMLLYDDCNNLVFGDEDGQRIGPSDIDSVCSNDGAFNHAENITLNVGSYGVNKILGLDAEAMQTYEERYVNANICVQDLIDMFYDLLLLADFDDCIDPICAQSCLNGMNPEDYTDIEAFKVDLIVCLEECDVITESDITDCEILKLTMLGDMTPYGQYGKVLDDMGLVSSDVSCLSLYTVDNIHGIHFSDPSINYMDGSGAPITVVINGVSTVPNNLSLDEFIFYHDASWIENLLPFHPEYCYLQWCATGILGSAQFDRALMSTNEYDEALAAGMLNPIGLIPSTVGYNIGPVIFPVPDPFFHSWWVTSPGYLDDMEERLMEFAEIDNVMYSAWDMAYMLSLGQVLDLEEIMTTSGAIPPPGQWDDVYGSAFCESKTFWKFFRGFYYAIKKELDELALDNYLTQNGCCPNDYIGFEEENCDGDVCADLLYATKRYIVPSDVGSGGLLDGGIDIDHIIQTTNDGNPDLSELDDAADAFYEANCAGYRQQWRFELEGCEALANLTEVEINALLDQMVEICILGSDLSHPVGSSTTPDPSVVSSGGFASFEAAIADAIAPFPFDSTCNQYVISAPYPYEINPLGGDDPALWPCACESYDAIFADYVAATGQNDIPGFHAYLETNYNIEYTVEELSSLACLCDNQSTDYIRENPLLLDGVLPPFVCIDCVEFDELAVLYNDFLTSPDNYFQPVDTGDLENPLYHDNVAGWLNQQVGFNLNYHEYATFFEDHELDMLTGIFSASNGDCGDLPDTLALFFHEIFSHPQITFPISFELDLLDIFDGSLLDLWPSDNPQIKFDTLRDSDGNLYHHITIELESTGAIVCELFLYGIDDLNDISGVNNISPTFSPGATISHSFNMEVTLEAGGTLLLNGTASCYTFEACTDQLCNRPIYPDPEDVPVDNCLDDLLELLFQEASVSYESQIDSARERFRLLYPQQCLANLQETLIQEYDLKEYHYTLYFYDQSQGIVRTIPPEGVHALIASQLNAVANHRLGSGPAVYPEHEFISHSKQNSLNEISIYETPDARPKQFWYDGLGRGIVAQDGRQKDLTDQSGYHTYSYTKFDALGRIIETGELEHKYEIAANYTAEYEDYLSWLSNARLRRYVSRYIYDESYSAQIDSYFDADRLYLRKRVSSVLYNEDAATKAYDYASHFDYDAHGNVRTLINEIRDLHPIKQGLRRIDYQYDLISGNVLEVSYQHKFPDAFYHRYTYDDDNRVVTVETSKDRVIWDADADYAFYHHGPLARTQLGDKGVQGLDHVYTIQGWSKGINSNTLSYKRDPSHDGAPGDPYHELRAADVMGFSLGYFNQDYNSIQSFDPLEQFQAIEPTVLPDLHNGNVSRMMTAIKDKNHQLLPMQPNVYRYDQLNRIVETQRYKDLNIGANHWENGTTDEFTTAYKYDANGNILGLGRRDGNELIDELNYDYYIESGKRTNKLNFIKDYASPTNPDDPSIKSQPEGNYVYDGSGNLISDKAESIKLIEWDHTGKVRKIHRLEGPTETLPELAFQYDATGNRIIKIVKRGKDRKDWTYTYYIRDGQGTLIAVYDRIFERPSRSAAMDIFIEKEAHLYGAARIGLKHSDKRMPLATAKRQVVSSTSDYGYWLPGVVSHLEGYVDEEPNRTDRFAGLRNYELSNHLGNVLSIVSDNKLLAYEGSALPKYEAEILGFNDYYPFGMLMPKRHSTSSGYRYGFNGMEGDDEISGQGNSYDYGERNYDPRIGRFRSLDAYAMAFPGISPYAYALNSPMYLVDQDGMYPKPSKILADFGLELPPFAAGILDGVVDASPWGTLGMVWDLTTDAQFRADMMDGLAAIVNDPIGTLGNILGEYKEVFQRVMSGNATPEDEYFMGNELGSLLVGIFTGGTINKIARKVRKQKGKVAKKVNVDAKEGVYEFTDTNGKNYTGQSGDIDRRLKEHVKSGKLDEANLEKVKRTEVTGGKTKREIKETEILDSKGGANTSKNPNPDVSNKVRPISIKREKALKASGDW